MAQPADKSEAVETFINQAFNVDRAGSVEKNVCISKPIGCGGAADKFNDALSAKEYTISGLCQSCQDKIFGG
jgi:hypothetical protein